MYGLQYLCMRERFYVWKRRVNGTGKVSPHLNGGHTHSHTHIHAPRLSSTLTHTFTNGMDNDPGVCRAHAFTQVLFLLLSLVLSERSQPEAKPLDFVCVSEARKVMNKVKDLQKDLAQCSAAEILPSPVRIPCIRVTIITWQSKPIPERKAEILQSFQMLAQDIQQARDQSQAECVLRLLRHLEHNINSYIHTLKQTGPDAPNVPDSSVQKVTRLSLVLQHLDRLISKKLEWLVNEMAKDCETETD